MKKYLLSVLASFVFCAPLMAGTVSFDQLAVSADLTTTKWNQDMNTIYNKVNSGIQTDNIQDGTLTEPDFDDSINPQVRTLEGASCEKVDDGLLPVTAASLTTNTAAGTAYPLGYRIDKTSATSHTYTASRWTFVDLDSSGNFQYQEVSIGAATPSVSANSIRLARVSTDGTTVAGVQDLRTTNCTSGPFEDISDASGEASLDDMFAIGRPVRNRGTDGFAQGAHVSWDTATTFKVTGGAVYINGEFRAISTDTTVPQTNDSPTAGTSGLDTGAIAANTRYNVFAVADQDAVKTYSITYSTAAAPAGVTNYRKIGEITTGAYSGFNSTDIIRTHGIVEDEVVKSFIHFDGSTTNPVINKSRNVSSLADGGTGIYTISWDQDYDSISYAVAGFCDNTDANSCHVGGDQSNEAFTRGTLAIQTEDNGAASDAESVTIIAVGDII